MISGVASHVAIRGWNFSTKAIKLKFSSLNPINGAKQLCSPESLMKLMVSVVKMIFVGMVAWLYVRGEIDSLATYQWAWTSELLTAISQLILGVLIRLCLGLLIIGIADLFYQKFKYTQKIMMTKVEVKDETKSQEGPPEIKSRIRKKQFELAVRRMLQDVPKANVVIVNPTHVAVALQYDAGTMASPIVVAKGGDHLCEKIKEIARAYGVPIIRRPALARNMYSTVEVGHPIPEPLFVAIAEVLALIWRLRQRK
jgi:flagellar biosynthetic protein FlhB